MLKRLLREIHYLIFTIIHSFKEYSINFNIRSYTRYTVKKIKMCKDCNISIGKDFLIRPGVTIVVDPGSTLIIGDHVHLNNHCRLRVTHKGTLIIGNNVYFARYSSISCWHKVIVNDDAIFAPYASLFDHQHKFDLNSPVDHGICDQFEPIEIGKGVWLGIRVCVLNGVRIGNFSVVGANSVVTKSIPDGCVAGGVPAKIIKE